jgi:hypothetical protein
MGKALNGVRILDFTHVQSGRKLARPRLDKET